MWHETELNMDLSELLWKNPQVPRHFTIFRTPQAPSNTPSHLTKESYCLGDISLGHEVKLLIDDLDRPSVCNTRDCSYHWQKYKYHYSQSSMVFTHHNCDMSTISVGQVPWDLLASRRWLGGRQDLFQMGHKTVYTQARAKYCPASATVGFAGISITTIPLFSAMSSPGPTTLQYFSVALFR